MGNGHYESSYVILTTFMNALSWKAPTATQITHQPPGSKPEDHYQKLSPETPHGCAHSTIITTHLSCHNKSRMPVKRLGLSVNKQFRPSSTHIYVGVCTAMREGRSRALVLRTVTTDLTCLPTPPVIEVSPNHCFLAR